MAIQGLPVPKTMIQAFMDSRNKRIQNELREAQIKNYMGQATMRPYEMKLKQAQAEEAMYNAHAMREFQNILHGGSDGSESNDQNFSGGNINPSQGIQTPPPGNFSGGNPPSNNQPAGNVSGGEVPMQQQPGIAPQQGSAGKWVTVNPGNPKLYGQDRLAGMSLKGMSVKPTQSWEANGVRYKEYPSGRLMAMKIGETQEEKRGLDVKQKKVEEENAADIKKSNDLVDVADFIIKQGGHAASLSDFYKKGYHSGPFNATRKWAKNAPEGAGIFSANATPLIAGPTKELSQRGGAIIAGMVQGSKPDYSQHDPYNKEILNDIHNKQYIAFQEAKKQWERLNPGKTFPKKLPKFYDKVRIVSPRGHEIIKPTEQLEAIINQFPGSTYRFEGD